jgi:hypothetical protein
MTGENEQKIKIVYLDENEDEKSIGGHMKMKNDSDQKAEKKLDPAIKMDAVGIQVKSDELKRDNKLRLSGI